MKRVGSQVSEDMSEKLLAGALWAVPAGQAPLAKQHSRTGLSAAVSVVMHIAPVVEQPWVTGKAEPATLA